MNYRLVLYPYCGGHTPLTSGELAVCKKTAAHMIRRHRRDEVGPVAILNKGREWELETGDDAVMIGDEEGTLKIEPICEVCDKRLKDDDAAPCERCQERVDAEYEVEEGGLIQCEGCGETIYRWESTDGACDDCLNDEGDDDDE